MPEFKRFFFVLMSSLTLRVSNLPEIPKIDHEEKLEYPIFFPGLLLALQYKGVEQDGGGAINNVSRRKLVAN